MAKRSVVNKGQARVRFKLETSETFLDLRNAVVSEGLAYRIYKMILDDQGKTGEPDLDAIFGPEKVRGALPTHPASVTTPRGALNG